MAQNHRQDRIASVISYSRNSAQPPSEDRGGSGRLLLVTYTPLAAAGGASARWRSFVGRLPAFGWEVDVLSEPRGAGADPGALVGSNVAATSRMRKIKRRAVGTAWRAAALRPQPLPTRWAMRGAVAVRRQVGRRHYDAVLATGPAVSALFAARLGLIGSDVPLVIEFRDLWAGNPAYDKGSNLLLGAVRWLIGGAAAVVVTSPEAEHALRSADLERPPLFVVPNGFEPDLLTRAPVPRKRDGPFRIIHSGALVAGRPLGPLLSVLAALPGPRPFELILQGYLAPEAAAELEKYRNRVCVELRNTAPWAAAIAAVRASDGGLVVQGRDVGDRTAVAAKTYEYLALGKPVLCISDGGATERLLRELGADQFCARLSDSESIKRALLRLRGVKPEGISPPRYLDRYRRDRLAAEMASLLRSVARAPARGGKANRL